MTDKLEKKFFDTFGIEAKTNQVYGVQLDYHIDKYPQITDTILLKLICLWNYNCLYAEDMITPTIYDVAKDCIFNYFIDIERYIFRVKRETIKEQVQTLFKETK